MAKRKFGPKKATKFIDLLEFSCKNGWWKVKRDKKGHRQMVTGMLRTFEQAERYLDQLVGSDENEIPPMLAVYPPAFRRLSEVAAFKGIPFTSDPRIYDLNSRARVNARIILPGLKNLIKNLRNGLELQPSKSGAPKTNLPLLIKMASYAYEMAFDETPKNGGLFLKVIKALLPILKLPHKDPRRAIREALKKPQ
jgi:hypothetical protein